MSKRWGTHDTCSEGMACATRCGAGAWGSSMHEHICWQCMYIFVGRTTDSCLCVSGNSQVYVLQGERGDVPKVQTDGINLEGVWAHADLVDINSIQTNDITAMLRTYGVEVGGWCVLFTAHPVCTQHEDCHVMYICNSMPTAINE